MTYFILFQNSFSAGVNLRQSSYAMYFARRLLKFLYVSAGVRPVLPFIHAWILGLWFHLIFMYWQVSYSGTCIKYLVFFWLVWGWLALAISSDHGHFLWQASIFWFITLFPPIGWSFQLESSLWFNIVIVHVTIIV